MNKLDTSQPAVRAGLKDIWKTVFHDPDAYIDHFFEALLPASQVLGKSDGGALAASVYVLPVGDLVSPLMRVPCTMTYALGTLPEFRGRGYGRALTNEAIEYSFSVGFSASVICPAEPSLFHFYEETANYRPLFSVLWEDFSAEEPEISAAGFSAEPASPETYAAIREELLANCMHIDFRPAFLRYQQSLCRASGGDLFLLRFGDRCGCAAVELLPDGRVAVKELLCPDGIDTRAAVSLIRREVGGTAFSLRSPAPLGDPSARPFAMARFHGAAPASRFPGGKLPWLGFAFD